MKVLTVFFLISFCIPLLVNADGSKDESKGTITVFFSNIRSVKGRLAILLFNQSNGFPADHRLAIKKKFIEIDSDKTANYQWTNLPDGEYAVSVYHDENNNKQLETNFLGIPKEGVGTSNNVKSSFGPPSFKEALFQLDKDNKEIRIKIKLNY